MHSFNNPFAEKTRKIFLWRVCLKAIVKNILNSKRSKNLKHFLKQCIILIILLPRKTRKILLWRVYLNAIFRNNLHTKTSATVNPFL